MACNTYYTYAFFFFERRNSQPSCSQDNTLPGTAHRCYPPPRSITPGLVEKCAYPCGTDFRASKQVRTRAKRYIHDYFSYGAGKPTTNAGDGLLRLRQHLIHLPRGSIRRDVSPSRAGSWEVIAPLEIVYRNNLTPIRVSAKQLVFICEPQHQFDGVHCTLNSEPCR